MACRIFGAKPLSKPLLRLLPTGPLGTNFSEILIIIQNFSFTKMHLKISSAKWRPFCPGGRWVNCIWWHTILSQCWSTTETKCNLIPLKPPLRKLGCIFSRAYPKDRQTWFCLFTQCFITMFTGVSQMICHLVELNYWLMDLMTWFSWYCLLWNSGDIRLWC